MRARATFKCPWLKLCLVKYSPHFKYCWPWILLMLIEYAHCSVAQRSIGFIVRFQIDKIAVLTWFVIIPCLLNWEVRKALYVLALFLIGVELFPIDLDFLWIWTLLSFITWSTGVSTFRVGRCCTRPDDWRIYWLVCVFRHLFLNLLPIVVEPWVIYLQWLL